MAIVLILLFSFLKKETPILQNYLPEQWLSLDLFWYTLAYSIRKLNWLFCWKCSTGRVDLPVNQRLWGRARQLDMGCCIAMCLAGQKRTPVSAKSRPVCSSTTWLFHVLHLNKRLGFAWAFFTSRPHSLIPVGNGSAISSLLTQHLHAISAQV